MLVFPLSSLNGNSSWSWNTANYDGFNNQRVLNYNNSLTTTSLPVLQINTDLSFPFNIELNSGNIGVQAFQFANFSPIPVCLATDCMVWTRDGLFSVQTLKSGCELIAVDENGDEFISTFDVFEQLPRNQEIEVCHFEEDVITGHNHAILFPFSECENYKCPECSGDFKKCSRCRIYNVKDHVPVVAKYSWLKIKKEKRQLYHFIPRDLKVCGFKVGKRRVLISEITLSDIQLIMSGFIKKT